MIIKFMAYLDTGKLAGIDCSLIEMLNNCEFLDYDYQESSYEEYEEYEGE